MRLADHFDTLLNDTVNINRSRLDDLDRSVDALYSALQGDDELGPFVKGKSPQGSWAQRTIIKPVGNREFDADVLLLLDHNPEWDNPKTYIDKVWAALQRIPTYAEMDPPPRRRCRCVTVTYAGDYHVDIVPCLEQSHGGKVIVNRDENDWEPTDPEDFTRWMRDKHAIANNNLREVIRLMKFLRDHRNTFQGTPSVILTTVIGNQVEEGKKIGDPAYYSGVPTALLHIVEDLDQWLQARPNKPTIWDPSNTGLTFDHRWEETTYRNFRDRIHSYAAKIHEAYHEQDKGRSVQLWQDIFGDGFKPPPAQEASGRFGAATATSLSTRPGRAG